MLKYDVVLIDPLLLIEPNGIEILKQCCQGE